MTPTAPDTVLAQAHERGWTAILMSDPLSVVQMHVYRDLHTRQDAAIVLSTATEGPIDAQIDCQFG